MNNGLEWGIINLGLSVYSSMNTGELPNYYLNVFTEQCEVEGEKLRCSWRLVAEACSRKYTLRCSGHDSRGGTEKGGGFCGETVPN